MHKTYLVKVSIENKDSIGEKLSGTAEFYERESAYGNGHGLYIKGLGEPFAVQDYDIRYNSGFDPAYPVAFLADMMNKRFSCKKEWRLTGITIEEVDA